MKDRTKLGVAIAGSAVLIGVGIASVTATATAPDPCELALDAAEAAFDAYSEGFDNVAQTFDASSKFDVARMEELNEESVAIRTDKLEPALEDYWSAAPECRAEG